MEDHTAPRTDAIRVAIISLIVRIFATQSAITNLWYSRRCYERSRGEMITMIFEKTLGRKIVSAPKQFKNSNSLASNGDVAGKRAKQSQLHPRSNWRSICGFWRVCFRSNPTAEQVKEPASMGKILNLMRYEFCSRSINNRIYTNKSVATMYTK